MLFLTQGVVFGSLQCWLGRCGNWSYLGKYPLELSKKFSSSIVQAFVIIEFGWEFSFQFKDFIDVFDYFAAKRFWGFVAAVFQRIDKIATNMSQAPQMSGPVEEIISCIAVSLDVAIKIAQQFLGRLGWSSITVSKYGNIFFFKFSACNNPIISVGFFWSQNYKVFHPHEEIAAFSALSIKDHTAVRADCWRRRSATLTFVDESTAIS